MQQVRGLLLSFICIIVTLVNSHTSIQRLQHVYVVWWSRNLPMPRFRSRQDTFFGATVPVLIQREENHKDEDWRLVVMRTES